MNARFFIDRALGAHLVPSALRRAGWSIVTMRERYGESLGQAVRDPVWIREATQAGECILTKDARVATRPAEAQTIYMCDARVFAFAKSPAHPGRRHPRMGRTNPWAVRRRTPRGPTDPTATAELPTVISRGEADSVPACTCSVARSPGLQSAGGLALRLLQRAHRRRPSNRLNVR